MPLLIFFFFNDTATTEIYTLSLHDALPIFPEHPDPAVVAAAHHPVDRDCAGRAHRYLLRGERHRQAAHPEPGDPEPAAVVRRVSARVVHFRSREDGRVRELHLARSAGPSRVGAESRA